MTSSILFAIMAMAPQGARNSIDAMAAYDLPYSFVESVTELSGDYDALQASSSCSQILSQMNAWTADPSLASASEGRALFDQALVDTQAPPGSSIDVFTEVLSVAVAQERAHIHSIQPESKMYATYSSESFDLHLEAPHGCMTIHQHPMNLLLYDLVQMLSPLPTNEEGRDHWTSLTWVTIEDSDNRCFEAVTTKGRIRLAVDEQLRPLTCIVVQDAYSSIGFFAYEEGNSTWVPSTALRFRRYGDRVRLGRFEAVDISAEPVEADFLLHVPDSVSLFDSRVGHGPGVYMGSDRAHWPQFVRDAIFTP